MQDMKSLQRMGMMGDEMVDEMEKSAKAYFEGETDAIAKRLNKVDDLPTQERKAKHTPRHMKKPLAKNMRKRQRKHGAFA